MVTSGDDQDQIINNHHYSEGGIGGSSEAISPSQLPLSVPPTNSSTLNTSTLNTSGNTFNGTNANNLSAIPPTAISTKTLLRSGSGSRGSIGRLSQTGMTSSNSFISGRSPSDTAVISTLVSLNTPNQKQRKCSISVPCNAPHSVQQHSTTPLGTPRRARVSIVVPCTVEDSLPSSARDDHQQHHHHIPSSGAVDGEEILIGEDEPRRTTPMTSFHPSIPDYSITTTNCSISQYAFGSTPTVTNNNDISHFHSDSFGENSMSNNNSHGDLRPQKLVPCLKDASTPLVGENSLSTPHDWSVTDAAQAARAKRISAFSVDSSGGGLVGVVLDQNVPPSPTNIDESFSPKVPSEVDPMGEVDTTNTTINTATEQNLAPSPPAENEEEVATPTPAVVEEDTSIIVTSASEPPQKPSSRVPLPTDSLSPEAKCALRARLFSSFLEEGVLLYRPHSKLTAFYDFFFLQRECTSGAFRRHYSSAFVQGVDDAVNAAKEANKASKSVLNAIMNPMDTKTTMTLFDTGEGGMGCFWLSAESERQWFAVSAPPQNPLAKALLPPTPPTAVVGGETPPPPPATSQYTPLSGAFFFPSSIDADEELTTNIVHPSNLCMFAVDVPPVPLGDYIARLISRMRCTLECFIYAMCLVRRVSSSAAFQHASWAAVQDARQRRRMAEQYARARGTPVPPASSSSSVASDMDKPLGWIPLTSRSVHRLFLTALVISAKMRNDRYYGMSTYAEVTGVSKQDLIGMEVALLTSLQFTAAVPTTEYLDMLFSLRHHCSLLAHSKQQGWAAQAWVSLIEHFTLPSVESLESELAAYETQLNHTLNLNQRRET